MPSAGVRRGVTVATSRPPSVHASPRRYASRATRIQVETRPAGRRSRSRGGGPRPTACPPGPRGPSFDDEEAVGHDHRLERVVGDHEHRSGEVRQVPRRALRTSRRVRASSADRGSSRSRTPGFGGQGPGQRDALGLAAGELAGTPVASPARSEPLHPVLARPRRAAARPAPARPRREGDVVAYGEVREEAVVLEDDADRAPLREVPTCRSAASSRTTVPEPDRAGGQRASARPAPRSIVVLPDPFGPEDAQHLARRHARRRPPARSRRGRRGRRGADARVTACSPAAATGRAAEASTDPETTRRTSDRAMAASGRSPWRGRPRAAWSGCGPASSRRR